MSADLPNSHFLGARQLGNGHVIRPARWRDLATPGRTGPWASVHCGRCRAHGMYVPRACSKRAEREYFISVPCPVRMSPARPTTIRSRLLLGYVGSILVSGSLTELRAPTAVATVVGIDPTGKHFRLVRFSYHGKICEGRYQSGPALAVAETVVVRFTETESGCRDIRSTSPIKSVIAVPYAVGFLAVSIAMTFTVLAIVRPRFLDRAWKPDSGRRGNFGRADGSSPRDGVGRPPVVSGTDPLRRKPRDPRYPD